MFVLATQVQYCAILRDLNRSLNYGVANACLHLLFRLLGHKVYDAFYPIFPPQAALTTESLVASPKNKPGRMVNSYTGKSIARSTPVTNLVSKFLDGRIKLAEGYAHLKGDFDLLVGALQAQKDEAETKKAERERRAAAATAAASEISRKMTSPGTSTGSPPAKRAKTRQPQISKFVTRGAMSKTDAQKVLDNDTFRFVCAAALPYSTMEGAIPRQFARTCFDLGRRGFHLDDERDGAMSLSIPKRKVLSGRLRREHLDHYNNKLAELKEGSFGVDIIGYGGSSDATTKYQMPMVNHALLLPPSTKDCERLDLRIVYKDLKLTRGVEKKGKEWQAGDLVRMAKEAHPFRADGMYYVTLDGACRHSFTAVEKAFRDDTELSNLVCIWCSTHGFHLLLQALSHIDGIQAHIEDVKTVITFVRSHGKPTEFLAELSPKKGLCKWAETRFGTEFIAMARVDDLEEQLVKMVTWDKFLNWSSGTKIKDTRVRSRCREFEEIIKRDNFFRRCKVVLLLIEPIYTFLRLTDSNRPTAGVIIYYWLEVIATCVAWEQVKFKDIDGKPAFTRQEFTMLTKGETLATGSAAEGSSAWSSVQVANYRWDEMHTAGDGRGGWMTAAAFALNPCFRKHELVRDENSFVRGDMAKYMEYAFPDTFDLIMQQYEDYLARDPDGDLFAGACCDFDQTKGVQGFLFWKNLPYHVKQGWKNLQLPAMKLLVATTSESDSERQFSRASHHHVKGRATMSVEHVGELVFIREEMLNELDGVSSNMYTPEWLESLEMTGQLERTVEDLVPATVPPPPPSQQQQTLPPQPQNMQQPPHMQTQQAPPPHVQQTPPPHQTPLPQPQHIQYLPRTPTIQPLPTQTQRMQQLTHTQTLHDNVPPTHFHQNPPQTQHMQLQHMQTVHVPPPPADLQLTPIAQTQQPPVGPPLSVAPSSGGELTSAAIGNDASAIASELLAAIDVRTASNTAPSHVAMGIAHQYQQRRSVVPPASVVDTANDTTLARTAQQHAASNLVAVAQQHIATDRQRVGDASHVPGLVPPASQHTMIPPGNVRVDTVTNVPTLAPAAQQHASLIPVAQQQIVTDRAGDPCFAPGPVPCNMPPASQHTIVEPPDNVSVDTVTNVPTLAPAAQQHAASNLIPVAQQHIVTVTDRFGDASHLVPPASGPTLVPPVNVSVDYYCQRHHAGTCSTTACCFKFGSSCSTAHDRRHGPGRGRFSSGASSERAHTCSSSKCFGGYCQRHHAGTCSPTACCFKFGSSCSTTHRHGPGGRRFSRAWSGASRASSESAHNYSSR